jgi:phenylalanyl-tRNA synthetase beta chain
MNISYNWLNNYIIHGMEPGLLADELTSCGLEVEDVKKIDSIPGGLKGLVIGKVLEVWKHPNADKLSLTKVDTGSDHIHQIVCGAPNVEAGQMVVVALPGTKIYPENSAPFEIKKAKIRGELSEGMICAEDEIGLGKTHDGIMVLDNKVKVGTLAKDHFGVTTDSIFTIGLTPNRPDATSHIGIARDIVALMMARQNKNVEIKWPDLSSFHKNTIKPVIDVDVQSDAAIRYSGVHIANITVADSPAWLKERLMSVGLNPINNIVDITNFVMYEMGQPLHAFDADKIVGNKIIVRQSSNNEKFVTLDDVERKLDGTELMICHTQNGMCIAGVFGGIASGVSDATTSIFLESACFDPVSIRKTSKKHGLNTDASFRFERGTDPNITITALKRAAILIAEISGGEVSSSVIDIYPDPINNFNITVSLKRINQLNGIETSTETFEAIMRSLEIDYKNTADKIYELSVPPYRVDVKREADIAEEVLRMVGYNNIPVPSLMHMSLPAQKKLTPDDVRNSLSTFLTSNGFTEVMNNSLSRSSVSEFFDENTFKPATIKNPLSIELDTLRPHMLFPILDTAVYNINRKRGNLRLFELGYSYAYADGDYVEDEKIALLLTGDRFAENWMGMKGGYSIYYLKSIMMNALSNSGIESNAVSFVPVENSFTTETLQIKLNGAKLGFVGKVSDKITKAYSIDGATWYGELNMQLLYKNALTTTVNIEEPPRYPEVKRDLSMILDKSVAYSELEKFAFDTERKILRKVNLFDVYEGDKIEKGKKSYAMSFYLRDNEKTLKDKDIDKVMNKLMSGFEKKLGAVVRKGG